MKDQPRPVKQPATVSPAHPVLTEERLNDLRRQHQNDIFPCVVVYGKELDALLAMAASVGEMRELLRECGRQLEWLSVDPKYAINGSERATYEKLVLPLFGRIDAVLERKAE